MPTRHPQPAARRALWAGLIGLLAAMGPTGVAAQEGAPSQTVASAARDSAALPDRGAPGWRTGALVLGGMAAIGFMHRRRRYD